MNTNCILKLYLRQLKHGVTKIAHCSRANKDFESVIFGRETTIYMLLFPILCGLSSHFVEKWPALRYSIGG